MTFITMALAVIAGAAGQSHAEYEGRDLIVYEPATMPAPGLRALIVVLHGGLGNADRIAARSTGWQSERALSLDAVAEKHGFLVAYLNGTKVARLLGDDKKGWNAGDCCGLPASSQVDDVTYIEGAVGFLRAKYGVDPKQVFAVGHSNGAMMALRLVCEGDVITAAMPFSGTLGVDPAKCTHAKGKRVMAVIGANDENVPIKGGRGTGLSKTLFASQVVTQQGLLAAGASFELQVVPGAEHKLETIAAVLEKTEKTTLGEKAARFFGLLR